MQVLRTVQEMEEARAAAAGTVGLVPTMGYLHEGHLSLVRRSRRDDAFVVVSIFVNPAQFGPGEDLDRYPRDEERDLAWLKAERVDAVFAPDADEIYPPGFDDWVEVKGPLATRLEGEHRPGHFRGVATVVAQLFRIVRPDRAYFGEKDAQQLAVIRRMTAEEGLPVEVVGMSVVREPDGLAMSSRNVYLDETQHQAALALSRSLRRAETLVAAGEWDASVLRAEMAAVLEAEPEVQTDYVSIADEVTFEELGVVNGPARALVAARVGGTRLIDNARLLPIDDVPIGRG
jgi:pantoate--beta-alanine ligase